MNNCLFVGHTIHSEWCNRTIALSELAVKDDQTIFDIEENAFNCDAFEQLEKLQLVNMQISHLKENIFNGLASLRTLHISQMKLRIIDANILEPLINLNSLLFEAIGDTPIDITNITGTTILSTTEIVSMRENNFREKINRKSFTGLAVVKSLYLSYSNIHTIGANTFDAIQTTIQLIDLRGNFLKTLPPNVFNGMYYRYDVSFYLSENQWHCLCDLLNFKANLISKPESFTDMEQLKCVEPKHLTDQQIIAAKFCDAETENPELPTDSTDEKLKKFIRFDCSKCDCKCNGTISIMKRMYPFTVAQSDGNGQLFLALERTNIDLMLFTFYNQKNDPKIAFNFLNRSGNCWKNVKLFMTLHIKSITDHYVFCLNDGKVPNGSPFDCVHYHFRRSSRLPVSSLTIFPPCFIYIIIAIIVISISVLIGLIIGMGLMPNLSSFVSSSSINDDPTIERNKIPKFHRNRILNRSCSMESAASGKSYVSPCVPFPFDAINWQMESMKSKRINRNYSHVSVADKRISTAVIPPLPKRLSDDKK